MKKVLIFAGGTGSIALQTGLHQLYGNSLQVDVVISAYDNGKSTGECRKIFGGKILGPSDLRKNQLTQFKLYNGLGCQNEDITKTDKKLLLDLFEERFSKPKWQESYDYAVARTKSTFAEIRKLVDDKQLCDKKEQILLSLIENFFFEEYVGLSKKVRTSVLTADLNDFSISNMFYASAAAINGNSLSKAGLLMADILGIDNHVHLISDINLYLYAEAKSGRIISDEGVIVTYDNASDPISKVVLLNEKGQKYVPSLDEDICVDVKTSKLIEQADIIIFSSGTQWSSLIPTYMHQGFYKQIKSAKAAKYLVMNNKEDRDMKGISASGMLNILQDYLPLDDVKIIINSNADEPMAKVEGQWEGQALVNELSEAGSKTHNPELLAKCIMKDYYKPYLNKKYYYFDFDDTIWSSSKDSFMRSISIENIGLLYQAFSGKMMIISGNSAKHFLDLETFFKEALGKNASCAPESFSIFCNGGNCEYDVTKGEISYKRNILNQFDLNGDYYEMTNLMLEALNKKGWNLNVSNFENRGNCILSIKPLQNRTEAKQIIDNLVWENIPLQDGKAKYTAYINGNTTIDVMNSSYNKGVITKIITKQLALDPSDMVYVGDKTDMGNDQCITSLGYVVLAVNDVVDFNVFVKTCLN